MVVIREPFVEIDLQVQYTDIDIQAQTEVPIVGAVVQSDYYCDYYYSLSEERRALERRAIEVKTKREYLTKIVRNNFILPRDHLSLKDGYYMSGTVRCFFAPEVGLPKFMSTYRTSSIRQAITITNYDVRRKDNSVTPNNYLFSTIIIEDKDEQNISFYHTAPSFNGQLANTYVVNIPTSGPSGGGIMQINSQNIYYIGVDNNIERIKSVCAFELIPNFGLCDNSAGPNYLIITQSYAILLLRQPSGHHNVFVYTIHKPETSELRNFLLSLDTVRFYTDTIPIDLVPDYTGISVTITNNTLNDFISFASGRPDDYYYYAPYIMAHYSSVANYYDYGGFYGFSFTVSSGTLDLEAITGNYVGGIWNIVLHDGSTSIPHAVNNCNTVPRTDIIKHEVSITNAPTQCILNVNGASVVVANFMSIIGKIILVSKYKVGYDYNMTTFMEALELLNMVDIIVDNGYTHTTNGYNMYADVIATYAHRTDNDKPPALAAITLPVNSSVSSALNIISAPAASSTFLCTNYFKTEALGYPVMLPSSTLYVQRIAALYLLSNAFAPIYNQPLIGTRPIDKIYNEREREILLDKRINSLKMYQNSWVFNNNLTATLDNSIFKEENIRRLANVVARECMRILKKYLGQQNVEKTRNSVIASIMAMKQAVIDIHDYKPDEFLVICDNTNNRDYERYLYVTIVIKMPLSVKYIELVTVAIDLEGTA